MRLDVKESRELKATILALRAIDKTISKQVRQHTKAIVAPEWNEALSRRARTRLERDVIVKTATVAVSNQNVRVRSASKGRPLSGGLNPRTEYPAVEFGADQGKTTTYNRRGHRVTRHTARQMRPRKAGGYVFWPAAKEMVPRLAALYVQTTVKTIAQALKGVQE